MTLPKFNIRLILFAVPIWILQILLCAQGRVNGPVCGLVGYVLATPSFNESIAATQGLCFGACRRLAECKSTNYFLSTRVCALNNVSHLDGCQKMTVSPGSFYAFRASSSDSCTTPTARRTRTDSWTEQDLSLVGKPSVQSTTYRTRTFVAHAQLANDGNTTAVIPWCTHTRWEPKPWWRVDLGSEHWIRRIDVLNRAKCCHERLIGATLRAGLSPDLTANTMCGSAVTAAEAGPGVWVNKTCQPPSLARYISVDITGKNTTHLLQICEVKAKEMVEPNCGF